MIHWLWLLPVAALSFLAGFLAEASAAKRRRDRIALEARVLELVEVRGVLSGSDLFVLARETVTPMADAGTFASLLQGLIREGKLVVARELRTGSGLVKYYGRPK